MQSPLFRKKSLERFSSPEALDQLMSVTTPLSWLALVSCLLLLLVGVIWGVFGAIPTKVTGKGILLKNGSLHDVVSTGAGRIEDIAVVVDDTVKEGQVLAHLSQPDIQHEIAAAESTLKNYEAERKLVFSLGTKTADLKNSFIKKQHRTLQESITSGEQRLSFLQKQMTETRNLYTQGIVTLEQHESAKSDYNRASQDLMKLRDELTNLSVQEIDVTSQREKELITIDHKIGQVREQIKALRENLNLHSTIISRYSGKVLELFKNRGAMISSGEPLLSLEIAGLDVAPLSALVYFHPLEGKKIKPGMKVNITPSTVKEEEYGSILGEVLQVSAFPASNKGMMRVLQNADLVKSLSEGGAPIMATVRLITNSASPSGFAWSSGSGPTIGIQAGTICSSRVVTNVQPPITLVLPYLKKNMLGIGESNVRSNP